MADHEINEARVRQVARLAALALSDVEVDELKASLSSILDYVDRLDEVAVEGVEPTFHPIPMSCPLREDRVKPSLPQEVALSQAPRAEAGGFAVPKVLDGD